MPPDPNTFSIIQMAMCRPAPRKLRFDYTAEDGTETKREVEPYELKQIGKGGQLIAWCLDRDAIRRFNLDHMRNVSEGEPFNARQPIKVPL